MIKKIESCILPIIEEHDCYIDNIEYVQERNDWYLRIYVDLNSGKIDMDTIVTLSELISEKLDEVDLIDNVYYLEVSSPGAEKELKTYEHVVNAIGEYVFIKLKDPKEGLDSVYCTLLDVNDNDVQIEYMNKNIKKKMVVDYNNISFIRLAVKF